MQMRYTLMCKDREVLEFDIELPGGTVRDVRPLEGSAWAPLGMLESSDAREWRLEQFIDNRGISFARTDLPAILEATDTQTPVELAFRSGGFSLSDPYWYRAPGSDLTWAESNFFDNEWDPEFGNAILQKDYHSLEKASIITPDVTCSGASRKAWIRDENGPCLFKASVESESPTTVAETLASRMIARVLPRGEFVPYELVERDGETYSACRPIVSAGEELSMAWQALSSAGRVATGKKTSTELLGLELLEELAGMLLRRGVAGAGQLVAKTELIAHLTFCRDIHPNNIGVIRTVESGALRLAPFFDFDRTFGLSHRERMKSACAHPEVMALFMANSFSNLDPSWDYSWYDPSALDGFEHEIERALMGCEAIPQGYAQLAADMFVAQRAYVNSIATGA